MSRFWELPPSTVKVPVIGLFDQILLDPNLDIEAALADLDVVVNAAWEEINAE